MKISDLLFWALTYRVRNNHVTTLSGQRMYVFRPDNPNQGEIRVEDFAHALSMLCRWGGHVPSFYSVSQHSVYAYRLAKARGYGWVHQMMALFHEVGEPVMADLPSPIKAAFWLYRWTEDRFQTRAFDILAGNAMVPYWLPAEKVRRFYPHVKEIDVDLLMAERTTLRGDLKVGVCCDKGKEIPVEPDAVGLRELVDPDFYYWGPDKAKEEFLKAAAELGLHTS